MNDPKLERCKQVIRQYEENQKKEKIELSKKPKKQRETKEKPKRTSISENIKEKINQETPKKVDTASSIPKVDKYQEAIDKDLSLTNFIDKLRDMEDEESEEETSLFYNKRKEEAQKRIDEQKKKGLTQAQRKALREKETKER